MLTIHPKAFIDWTGPKDSNTIAEIMREFAIDGERVGSPVVVAAIYECGDYEGQAFVLLWNPEAKEFASIDASHCSCYGLEGQWTPEATTFAALQARNFWSYDGDEAASKQKEAILEAAWAVMAEDLPEGVA